jgi:hypothetical protein
MRTHACCTREGARVLFIVVTAGRRAPCTMPVLVDSPVSAVPSVSASLSAVPAPVSSGPANKAFLKPEDPRQLDSIKTFASTELNILKFGQHSPGKVQLCMLMRCSSRPFCRLVKPCKVHKNRCFIASKQSQQELLQNVKV